MARAYGSSAGLLLKRESTYGTRATGNYTRMPFNSCNLGSEQGLIDDPVLGMGRDPLQPLLDVINDEGDIVVPVDPRYLGFWLTGIFGDPDSDLAAAEGYIDFAVNPTEGDTVTINGVDFTFVDDMPSAGEVEIQATLLLTLDALVTALNGSSDDDVNDATYSHPGTTQRLKIVHDVTGATGNSFTLTASAATISGKTLTGGGYAHVFTSGNDTLPSYSAEVGLPQVPAFFMHTGVIMNSISFDFQRSGAAAATVNVVAQGETRFSGSMGGTPAELSFGRISQFQGAIKSGGQRVANLTAGSIAYSNNVERIETIRDDGLIDGADPTIAALTGSIDVRFANTTMIDAAAEGEPVDLEFSYILSPGLSLKITAHEVYLPKPKVSVTGPGGVQASFDFQGARNAIFGRMLTVTLLNDLDGTQYA